MRNHNLTKESKGELIYLIPYGDLVKSGSSPHRQMVTATVDKVSHSTAYLEFDPEDLSLITVRLSDTQCNRLILTPTAGYIMYTTIEELESADGNNPILDIAKSNAKAKAADKQYKQLIAARSATSYAETKLRAARLEIKDLKEQVKHLQDVPKNAVMKSLVQLRHEKVIIISDMGIAMRSGCTKKEVAAFETSQFSDNDDTSDLPWKK